MGYYISIQHSDFTIKNEHRSEVVKLWKLLNHPVFNKYKHGGNGKGVRYAWLDHDYDQKFHTVEDLANQLNFTTETLSNGDILLTDYEGECGDQDLFLDIIRPYCFGEIQWIGEDCEHWTYSTNSLVYHREAVKTMAQLLQLP